MVINFNIKNFGSIKEQQTLSFEAEKTEHLEDFYVTKIWEQGQEKEQLL
jgi:AAA15 family ATPase/GTPase